MSERRQSTRHRGVAAGVVLVLGLGAAWFGSGCEKGQPPYDVISPTGSPEDFLPPEGIRPSSTVTVGRIYHFDRTRFRLFAPVSGTQPRFIKRDSVLALASAGLPGQPLELLRRPDLSDPTLAGVYAETDLFGFAPADPASVGFRFGRAVDNIADYWPVHHGNRWEFDHNGRQWILVDSIGGSVGDSSLPPEAKKLWTNCKADSTRRTQFLPPAYSYDTDFTVNSEGILFHAWRLIAERVVLRENRTDLDRQRNPRSLWLSIPLGGNPMAPVPVSVDQCLDDLPSRLETFALRLCSGSPQEGQIYTTWTYLDVPTPEVRARLDSEAQVPGGGRCGFEFVTGVDTLRLIPTRTYRQLCRFDVEVDRVADQIELFNGEIPIGRYPRVASDRAIVKFRITMSVSSISVLTPVQLIELTLQRNLGPVIRNQGVNLGARSNARLATATIAGTVLRGDDPNSPFFYFFP